jgi:hypothetical protein
VPVTTGSEIPTRPLERAGSAAREPVGGAAFTDRTWVPWRTYAVAGIAYLAASIVLWWHVFPHPASITTCGCGDASLTLWVIRWPAYALSHGLNPLYSSKLFVPHGINMVPNSLALGTVTAPVTWIFGPVASLNVIDVLSPPLSALAMFWLLRRWTSWAPAAFVGGLFFGFSPFVLVSLALAHPNFALMAGVPLIVGCVDELFVRRRRSPIRVGIVLGLLLVVQFFVSVEVLALVVLFAIFAALGFGVGAVVRRHTASAEAAVRAAAPGLAIAGGIAAVLLAYPLWFFFAGPAHLVGRAWPNSPAGTVVNRPADFVDGQVGVGLTRIMHSFGGYQGPRLPLFCLLGGGLLAVLVVGVAWWRHDRVVRWFGALGAVAVVLSFGIVQGIWTPWRLFVHLPVLVNVVPVNITSIIDTCVAVVLAVFVDRARSVVAERSGGDHAVAGVAGVGVALLALVPIGVAFWPNVPMTVRPVRAPRWFAGPAPRLSHLVVLPYPAALGGIQSSMAWQATEGMTFSMVGGGGPGIAPSRAGPEQRGFDVLNRAALPLGPAPLPTAANLSAIRQAVDGWGVTTIVVPDQPGLPSYDRGRSVDYAVGLFTAALGTGPVWQARAWVWQLPASRGTDHPVPAATFARCTGAAGGAPLAPTVAACILGRS